MRELTSVEMEQVGGSGLLGDAWNAVKGAAGDVGKFVKKHTEAVVSAAVGTVVGVAAGFLLSSSRNNAATATASVSQINSGSVSPTKGQRFVTPPELENPFKDE